MSQISCPLQYNAQNLNQHAAAIFGERCVSYGEFYQMVSFVLDQLKNFNIAPKDHVGIFEPNSVEYLALLYALWYRKVTPCLINTRLPEERIAEQLKMTGSKVLITSVDGILHSAKIQTTKIDSREIFKDAQDQREKEIEPFQFSLDQNATILFTSGSTSEPKAAVHTFANHYYSAKGSNEHISLHARDKWLLSLPLYHVGGLAIIFRTMIAGAALVIANPTDDLNSVLDRYKVTHVSLVSTQLFRLLKDFSPDKNLNFLKAVLLGGGVDFRCAFRIRG